MTLHVLSWFLLSLSKRQLCGRPDVKIKKLTSLDLHFPSFSVTAENADLMTAESDDITCFVLVLTLVKQETAVR